MAYSWRARRLVATTFSPRSLGMTKLLTGWTARQSISGSQPPSDREARGQGGQRDPDEDQDRDDSPRVVDAHPRRDEVDTGAQVLVDAEMDAEQDGAARQDRADERREHPLEDERGLDEAVGSPDQPHDPELPSSRVRRQADRGRDEEHSGDEHQRRDADRDVGRDGEGREEGFEILQLILDLLDAVHAPEGLDDDGG